MQDPCRHQQHKQRMQTISNMEHASELTQTQNQYEQNNNKGKLRPRKIMFSGDGLEGSALPDLKIPWPSVL